MSKSLTKGTEPNSSRIRKFIKKGSGAVVFRSDAYRKLLLLKHFIGSYYQATRAPHLIADVRWLFIFAYITINMFHNMRVVFGLCLWWVGLALIANAVDRTPEPENPSYRSPVSAYKKLAIRLPR